MINTQGKVNLNLELDGTQYQCEFVIADIEADVILGLNFLTKECGLIDLANNTLVIGDQCHQLNSIGTLGCCRLHVLKSTMTQARSEWETQRTSIARHRVNTIYVRPLNRSIRRETAPRKKRGKRKSVKPHNYVGTVSAVYKSETTPCLDKIPVRSIRKHVQRRVKCSLCGTDFKKKQYLRRHQKRKHSDASEPGARAMDDAQSKRNVRMQKGRSPERKVIEINPVKVVATAEVDRAVLIPALAPNRLQ